MQKFFRWELVPIQRRLVVFLGLDTPERQPEFLHDIRPELAQHIRTYVPRKTISYGARHGSSTPILAGMVNIAQCHRAANAQPAGIIKHVCPIRPVCNP